VIELRDRKQARERDFKGQCGGGDQEEGKADSALVLHSRKGFQITAEDLFMK
jgi:hypothetical protein